VTSDRPESPGIRLGCFGSLVLEGIDGELPPAPETNGGLNCNNSMISSVVVRTSRWSVRSMHRPSADAFNRHFVAVQCAVGAFKVQGWEFG